MWAPSAEGEGEERAAGRPRLPRERDEKLESVMGRGETYETDVNFERRERGVSAGGGNEPDGDSVGGGACWCCWC